MNQRKDNLHTTKTNELQTSFQHTLNKNKVHCRHFRSLPLTNYQRQINTIFQTARIYINHFFQHIAFLEFSVQLNISYQTFNVYQIRDKVYVLRRNDDPQRSLRLVRFHLNH